MVLALTGVLRKQKVVGAWLEFYGEGAAALTFGRPRDHFQHIRNMVLMAAMFCRPTNHRLPQTDFREDQQVQLVEHYAKVNGLWADKARGRAVRVT